MYRLNFAKCTFFSKKINACYRTSTTVHTKCASNVSKSINYFYEFDIETYGANSAMTLYYAQCK